LYWPGGSGSSALSSTPARDDVAASTSGDDLTPAPSDDWTVDNHVAVPPSAQSADIDHDERRPDTAGTDVDDVETRREATCCEDVVDEPTLLINDIFTDAAGSGGVGYMSRKLLTDDCC